MPRVFFITGTSTGFGNNLVQEVLDRGDIVVAIAREPESLSFKNTTDKASLQGKPTITKFLTNPNMTNEVGNEWEWYGTKEKGR